MSTASTALARQYGLVEPLRITDGITNRMVSKILKEAADEAEQELLKLAGKKSFSAAVRREQSKQVIAALRPISTELWTQTGKIVRAGEYKMGQLAADQALDLALLSGMPADVAYSMTQALHFEARQAVDDLISRHTNGYTLKERIYRNGKLSTRQVGRVVDRALARQLSARQLAAQVKHFYAPNVPGGANYAAMRLARTEINNAHHETTIRLSREMPWVTGFKWNLSDSHPRPDPCDALADRDIGLGPGVYGKNDAPSRPHPQCLCYLTHDYMDEEEMLNGLASGRFDQYIEAHS